MRLLQFCKYFFYIKTYFNRLPKDIQDEIVEVMQKYYNLARIARCIDLSKEDFYERSRQDCRD